MFVSDQYEIKELIGEGGMGKVYRAYDRKLRAFVAIKTIVGMPDRESLKLFQKECSILTALCHPNIVDIKAIGEFEEAGQSKPFFVMPFLPGVSLARLIRDPDHSHRLTVESTADIFEHVLRALQSAHDKGIIHRDIKPSNIFVMDDDSVKVIDFGIAQVVDARTTIEQGGTPLYMSPEQLGFAPLTRATDIFSLGVVCYETLTRHHPFKDAPEGIREAILHGVPSAASNFNPSVSFALSQVVHKAMAKAPQYRFSTADEFRGMLQRALRNEGIQLFNVSRIRPRIERARKAFEEGDLSYASEILEELETEGHLDSEMSALHDQISRSKRQRRVQQLLESARARMEEEEYGLAMQKVQEVLEIDRENAPALGLKSTIAERNTDRSVDEWLSLAQHHLGNRSYKHAIQALQDVLRHRPRDEQALRLLTEVNRSEQEYLKLRAEKERAYEAARIAWQNGEISTALSKMQSVLELDRQAPDPTSRERAALYQQFFNQVRSEHDLLKNAYDEAAQQLQAGQFKKALEHCEDFLAKYPNYAPLQMLRFDIEERERQSLSKYVAEVDQRLEAEPDLDKRIALLKEAAGKYPEEVHFTSHLKLLERKRELVRGIVAKARLLAEREQFPEAKAQWETLWTIYPQYPGLDLEIDRLVQRRDQQRRTEEKAEWVGRINLQLESGEYAASLDTIRKLQTGCQREPEFAELERRAQRGIEHSLEIEGLRSSGNRLIAERSYEQGIAALRSAYGLESGNRITRADLVNALLEFANSLLHTDWRSSRLLIDDALNVDPANAWAKTLVVSVAEQEAREKRRLDRSALPAEPAAAPPGYDLPPISDPLGEHGTPGRRGSIERPEADRLPTQPKPPQAGLRPPAPPTASTAKLPAAGGSGSPNGAETSVSQSSAPGRGRVAIAGPRRDASSAAAGVFRLRELLPRRGVFHSFGVGRARRVIDQVRHARYYPYSILLPVCGAVAIIAGSIVLTSHKTEQVSKPKIVMVRLQVETSPSGATVQVSGKVCGLSPCKTALTAGSYDVRASKAGYADAQTRISVRKGEKRPKILVTLEPLLAGLRVVEIGTKDSKVQLDDGPVQKFKDAEFAAAPLTGSHSVKIIGGTGGTATVQFDAEPGSMPVVQPPDPDPFEVVVISSVGGDLSLWSAPTPLTASLDSDQPELALNNVGLDLHNVAYGAHELRLNKKKLIWKKFEVTSAPALTIFLLSQPNTGTLIVNTVGSGGGEIYIDGSPSGPTRSGQVKLPLTTGQHQVTVKQAGYNGTCTPSTVQIQQRVSNSVNCQLQPAPQWASLQIQGVPPDSEVFLDNIPLGLIKPDGNFSSAQISPGQHYIELRAQGYNTKGTAKTFEAGNMLKMTASDFPMEAMPGLLTVLTLPPAKRITITPDDEASTREVQGGVFRSQLKPGIHTVTAIWPSGLTKSRSLPIMAGKPLSEQLSLDSTGMEGWGQGVWQRDGAWFKRSGRGPILFNVTPNYGSFEFSFALPTGGMRWVLNYVDDRNYDLFEISRGSFLHTRVVNGKKKKFPRKAYPATNGASAVLRIDVTSTSLKHQLVVGGKTIPIDTLTDKNGNFVKGKFGFMPRNNDVIEISNFKFQPD
ncbi:MAG TPA: protein kinase [Terriglobia bacterium]|nr:protein kinase [Terriglobia bacterium]